MHACVSIKIIKRIWKQRLENDHINNLTLLHHTAEEEIGCPPNVKLFTVSRGQLKLYNSDFIYK